MFVVCLWREHTIHSHPIRIESSHKELVQMNWSVYEPDSQEPFVDNQGSENTNGSMNTIADPWKMVYLPIHEWLIVLVN